MDHHQESFKTMAKDIWENPEVAFSERHASAIHREALEKAGFNLQAVENLPTAFVASFGSGEPVLGLLGEYDALAQMAQAESATQEAEDPNAPGHGCGHNLLGVASLAAALALQKVMAENGLQGTLRYYGCPAEEMLYGKVAMARAGVFRDLDACVSWHPASANMAWAGSMLAICSAEFHFSGKAAHAGAAPHLGRSALDAVELMDTGANYMREHVPESSRIHYIITNGGHQPNTVPADASVWFNLRARQSATLLENYRWLTEIAQGAAMMTQTRLEPVDFKSGVYEVLSNQHLVGLLEANMRAIGAPTYSAAAHEFAAALTATLTPEEKQKGLESNFLPHSLVKSNLHEAILSPTDLGRSQSASTDAGDVSHITPFAQFGACTWPLGVVPHTWQATASAGSEIGFTGMIFAAKVLACTLLDLFMQPQTVAAAQAEFQDVKAGEPYVSLIDRVRTDQ